MSMRRVCDEYATLPDFILGITDRIWEGRDLDLIRKTYGPDVVMHTGLGDSRGVAGVVAGTLATLHAFPDRRLLGEDVIWSGEGPADAYSSHRVASTMHHRGDGLFGAPTGRPVLVRTAADCLVRDGMIVEEWLVRDQGAIADQIGLPVAELAARLAASGTLTLHEPGDGAGTHAVSDGAGTQCVAAIQRIWNETGLSAIRTHYDPGVVLHLPGARCVTGQVAMDGFVIGYLAAFPDAHVTVEHVIVRNDPGRPVRVALRWRLVGSHTGTGAFGAPSGARIAIPGVTHTELSEGRVTREFVMVDELAVWTSIALRRG